MDLVLQFRLRLKLALYRNTPSGLAAYAFVHLQRGRPERQISRVLKASAMG